MKGPQALTSVNRARTPLDILELHQFPDNGSGNCTANDGWGLYADPPDSDNKQMAQHQIEMLEEAGFKIVRK